MLTSRTAGYLVKSLREGASLAIVSDDRGAGKSSLLWSLVEAADLSRPQIFVRGQYEPFAFARVPEPGSPDAILMINEISPYLPVYCWGCARDRLFGPEFTKYQKVATAHAATPEAFHDEMVSWTRGEPKPEARPFDIVVFLSRADDPAANRRVSALLELSR